MLWQALAALIGIALMAAPGVLGLPETTGVLVNILAPISAAFAIVAISEVTRGVRWASALAAAALAVGVIVLGASMPELVLVAGAAVVMAVLVTRGGRTSGSFGGGWRVLLG